MASDRVQEQLARLVPELTELRRRLHSMAELSFMEKNTSALIAEYLSGCDGIEVSRPTPTSVLGILKGAKPGKTVGFRADIDALPIQEPEGLPYRSVNDGVMHACGHDGHTAMLLAAAKALSGMRDQLRGEIRFIFQHAEELPPGGAAELVKAGVCEGLDAVYGLHLTSTAPTGVFEVCPGPFTSATDRFDAVIVGKGGHSSMPEDCIDPIVIGAQFITALQTVVSRSVSAFDRAVVSACMVSAGDAYNIIPGEMKITGSVRTFDPGLRERVPELIERLLRGTSEAGGASCRFSYELGYSSVVNDPGLTAFAGELVARYFGRDRLRDARPVMPGEDFSALHRDCPGFFIRLGAGNAAKGTTAPHHNPAYKMDEDALKYGTEYWVRLGISASEA